MWLTRPLRGGAVPGLAVAASLAASPLAPLVASLAAALPGAVPAAAEPVELLALNGFDPVSYFLEGGPLPGSARFELSWGGRIWRFSGAGDRAVFRADPEVYAPRLGGYDAAGILDGHLADADPLVFAVIGERLYLFRDAARRARFLADPGLARSAEAAWPGLRGLMDVPPAGVAPLGVPLK